MRSAKAIYVAIPVIMLLIAVPVGISNFLIVLNVKDVLETNESVYRDTAGRLMAELMENDRQTHIQRLTVMAAEIEDYRRSSGIGDLIASVNDSHKLSSYLVADNRFRAIVVFDQHGQSTGIWWKSIAEQDQLTAWMARLHKDREVVGQAGPTILVVPSDPMIRLSVLIKNDDEIIGSIQCLVSIEQLYFKTQQISSGYRPWIAMFIKRMAVIMIGLMAMALLLSVLFVRYSTLPMTTMAAALGRLRNGEYSSPMPERGLREVREMAASYNALRGTLAEKARLDQDLLAAREIQVGLLPKEKLDVEGWEVWGLCLPAREVGGDFYFWHTRKNRVYAGVGDISGKGMRASLLAALSMGSLKTVFRGEEALEDSFPVLNDILYHEFKGKGFLCMNAVDLAGGSGRIALVNAGQSYPILIKDHRTLEYWVLENGDLPLGAVGEVHYRKDPLQLSEGQGLILFSDGGPELKDHTEKLLGFEGFLGILQETMEHDLETWGRKALEALTAWRGEAPQHDDITLLFLRYGRKKWKTTRIM